MTLRTVSVPNPPAGQDWQVTVPGHELWNIVGITATLNGPNAPSALGDSSGNGHPLGSVDNTGAWKFGQTGPYGGGGGGLAVGSDGSGQQLPVGKTAQVAAFDLTNLTCMWFAYVGANVSFQDYSFITDFGLGNNMKWGWGVRNNTNNPYDLDNQNGNNEIIAKAAFASRNVWHHIAVTANGAQWEVFLDGASNFTYAQRLPIAGDNGQIQIGGSTSFGVSLIGRIAGVALWNSVLSGGTIASLAGSGGSAAAYKAAALAQSPLGLWMLDGQTVGPSRTVALDITDGTTIVDAIPSGPSALASGGPYVYSWVPELAGTVTAPAGTSISVPIPNLVLPAGYTIGTSTPDIGGTDQWSNITVWWNDDIQEQTGGVTQFVYPPGAYLSYQRQGALP